ncbi:restriction endonuclease [Limnochorda pilosa]|uniref:Restriction endonuclease n=1 Tax=Limnochorda pilosa TaxID=1555112 RepID=A0A0K2SI99_LIMPI|nr:restriction endonuclease [Limnochorda pilosa]BAS26810.1 restriction endonuclease [Limnochorda pilosa]
MARGPQFVEFMGPILDALRHLGGSARPGEVEEWIATALDVPADILHGELTSGRSRFKNRVHWARFYLAKAGLVDSSRRGVWSLTERGRASSLNADGALDLFRELKERLRTSGSQEETEVSDGDLPDPEELQGERDYKAQVLELLGKLPPDGFERLCQRLLRESGFENVTVTGRSGDGGIDGHGVLRVNPLVSFYVYFQCKRCSHSVGPSVVRDFRGAMMGRADKGMILTTATFTSEARKEAIRDGVPPIELVDGEVLVEMLANLELGLVPRTVYEVDERFFVEFGHTLPGAGRDG